VRKVFKPFVSVFTVVCFVAGCTDTQPDSSAKPIKRPKPTFRTLYVNDVSHIAACRSPYNPDSGPFTEQALISSIDETVKGPASGAIDVHMLQPCFTWVPWWQSKVYPPKEHYRWFYKTTGLKKDSNGLAEYLINGGDMIEVFTRRCRELGISPFISFRLNDIHYKEYAHLIKQMAEGKKARMSGFDPGKGMPGAASCISRFFIEHPEYWVGPEPVEQINSKDTLAFLHDYKFRNSLRTARSMNWAYPEVREHIFSFIEEICRNYDIDGLELDFMRSLNMFQPQTPVAKREEIAAGFVRRARKLLNETSAGSYRWLSVRVPFWISDWARAGINLEKFVEAGVDMVTLSCHYITRQQCDIAKITRMIPDTPVYLEFTFLNDRKKIKLKTVEGKSLDQFNLNRQNTVQQIYTLAHLAYSRGAQGVSAFNFAYYRLWPEKEVGCESEPPFHIFKYLKQPEWLARQPQHYFISSRDSRQNSINKRFGPEERKTYYIDLAAPSAGWKKGGRLRIQTAEPYGSREFKAWLNGRELEQTCNISEFYPPSCYDCLGDETDLLAWNVPAEILVDGINSISLEFSAGKTIRLEYIDLGIE